MLLTGIEGFISTFPVDCRSADLKVQDLARCLCLNCGTIGDRNSGFLSGARGLETTSPSSKAWRRGRFQLESDGKPDGD